MIEEQEILALVKKYIRSNVEMTVSVCPLTGRVEVELFLEGELLTSGHDYIKEGE